MSNRIAPYRTYTTRRLREIAEMKGPDFETEARAALQWCANMHDAADEVLKTEQSILRSARTRTKATP